MNRPFPAPLPIPSAAPMLPPGWQSLPVMDEEQLGLIQSLQEEDAPDVFQEIAGIFLEEAGVIIPQIEEAGQTGNLVVLKRLAHRLKGSANTFGACRLTAVALELENAADEERVERLPELLVFLEQELAVLRDLV